jgi:hypothetical protein
MGAETAARFHAIHGKPAPRVSYFKRDFVDYVLMLSVSAALVGISYGPGHPLALAGFGLCATMLAAFVMRHGVQFTVPLLLRRPLDVVYMVVYKLQNLKPPYVWALALLAVENALIALMPDLPHHTDAMRKLALGLFYFHLAGLTVYRTAIFVAHLRKRAHVKEVLSQTVWKTRVTSDLRVTLEILHGYGTGLLTHIILLAPWYLVITRLRFSVIALVIACAANLAIQLQWLRSVNAWFYRDHWLGHNSEFEFVWLHGTHHDAIPSGMIAVAGNGLLEGFARHALGSPLPFYNPLIAFAMYTVEVLADINSHQYIPGVFPRQPKGIIAASQHASHHYGKLEPYGFGIDSEHPAVPASRRRDFARFPEELRNSIRLDQELTGFRWDNAVYRRTMALYEKYH